MKKSKIELLNYKYSDVLSHCTNFLEENYKDMEMYRNIAKKYILNPKAIAFLVGKITLEIIDECEKEIKDEFKSENGPISFLISFRNQFNGKAIYDWEFDINPNLKSKSIKVDFLYNRVDGKKDYFENEMEESFKSIVSILSKDTAKGEIDKFIKESLEFFIKNGESLCIKLLEIDDEIEVNEIIKKIIFSNFREYANEIFIYVKSKEKEKIETDKE